MTTSKYVLNFDELVNELVPELRSLSKNVRREPFELNQKVKKNIKEILNKVPKGINFGGIARDVNNFIGFLQKIDELKGSFHVDGGFKNIPAIKSDYEIVFKYEADIYITGVVFSLSAWKKEDRWSLKIGDDVLFYKLTTKEIGDKKFFNIPCYVSRSTDIKLIFHNKSGNSRQVWCDLEYIKAFEASQVLVKCMDIKGKILKLYYENIQKGKLQIIYAPSIPHYYLLTNPNYVESIFNINNNTVTFVYEKSSIVHVKCIDKRTKEILKEYDIETNPKISETISAPDITGYVNVGTSSVIKEFQDGDIVEFEYIKLITIEIKCVDEYGNTLKVSSKSIIEGETITVNAPSIDGYTAISKNPISGVFQDGDIVEFIYSHPWGVKITMNWEGNSRADMDIYGFYKDKMVYFGHRQESNKLWLDVDNQTHIEDTIPEVLTCDYNTGRLIIGVKNYNGIPLSQPITFKVEKYDDNTHTKSTIKEINATIPVELHVYAICEIDLVTKEVIELNHSDILF